MKIQKHHNIRFSLIPLAVLAVLLVASLAAATLPASEHMTRSAASDKMAGKQPRNVKPQRKYLAYEVRMEGGISPAQSDLLEHAIYEATERGATMLLLTLDTPGGLVSSMREIVGDILNAPMPVVVWVTPSGSRAASAGAFIVAAGNVAAMSPQTTLGAASPVSAGGDDIEDTMARKVKNDLKSFVRSVAESRGRNAEWYEEAIDDAVSITADEAVIKRVVDLIAVDREDLFDQIGSKGLDKLGSTIHFDASNVRVVQHVPGWRFQLLSWLLDPSIAYFLLLAGLAGLFFEVTTPGAIIPGVAGVFCLVLGAYALTILPTNAAGLLLMLFGIVCFGLEIKIVSYGLLGLAGVVALTMGSLILFKENNAFGTVPLGTVLGTVAAFVAIMGTAVYLVAKAAVQPSRMGEEGLVGAQAEVRSWDGSKGMVLVRGELWSAHSRSMQDVKVGDVLKVTEVNGLKLFVEPLDDID